MNVHQDWQTGIFPARYSFSLKKTWFLKLFDSECDVMGQIKV